MWEITVRGIRNARPFVYPCMMRFVKQANFARAVAAAFGLAAVAALGFLSIGGDGAEAATTHTVFVNNSVFCGSAGSSCTQPFSTTISVGDTVQWLDGQAGLFHSATECTGDGTGCPAAGGFDSGILSDPEDNMIPIPYLTETFNSAGTFFYFCSVHGISMRGIITVSSGVTPSPPPATPTTVAVGGLADFPDIDESPADASGSSEGSSFALAALVSGLVAALAMFAVGAWYARRRWLP